MIPLAARELVQRTIGASDARFFARPTRAGFVFAPARGVSARLSASGVVVHGTRIAMSLGMRGYGYGTRLRSSTPVQPAAIANRVIYNRQGVQEWYANGPEGVEQGFTIMAPPTGTRTGPLTLWAAGIPASATASMTHDAHAVSIARAGHVLMQYSGLLASDARGRKLRAWIEIERRRLLLRIDDRGAVYPLRVDPFVQAAELTASDGAPDEVIGGGDYGASILMSGDGSTLVAASPYHTVGTNKDQGALYVFVKPAGGWANAHENAELTASDGQAYDGLGGGENYSDGLAISNDGSTIVVGDAAKTVNGNANQGALYVFSRPAGGWASETQTAELTGSDGGASDYLGGMYYGGGLAISGDGSTIVAGRGRCHVGTDGHGAVYVFAKPVSGWIDATQTAKLTASDASTGYTGFGDGCHGWGPGAEVSDDGSTIVTTAWAQTVGAHARQGAVYVYTRPDAGWADATQTAELTASDGAASDELGYGYYDSGYALSADGSTIVAASGPHTVGANAYQGALYVFSRPASGWADGHQSAELTTSDGGTQNRLGSAWYGGNLVVSADGSTVGVSYAQGGVDNNAGGLYVFARPVSGWADEQESAKLTTTDSSGANDWLGGTGYGGGLSISGDGSRLFAIAPSHAVDGNVGQGALYEYVRPQSGWASETQSVELTACDGAAGDGLDGSTVSRDGSAVASFAEPAANNNAGTDYVFPTVVAQAPCAVTLPATFITASTATLNGTLNPHGHDTHYYFQWGETSAYGSTTPIVDAGSGSAATEASAPITGLTVNTVYHFRLVAYNTNGTAYGADQTFSTYQPSAIVTTGSAQQIGSSQATLTGTVNPEGGPTTYQFEWGPTDSYGYGTNTTSAGSGTTDVPVSATLYGLTPGKTYHFRLVANNSAGPSYGADMSFTTHVPGPPVVATEDASAVTASSATLHGSVDPSGQQISDCHFDFGSGAFTTAIPCQTNPGAGFGPVEVSAVVTGLQKERSYQFRLSATNVSGTRTGATKTLQACGSSEVKFGDVDALGCFTDGGNGTWISSSKVRVNGVDLEPSGGTISLDPASERLNATGNGTIRIGGTIPVPWFGALSWNLSGDFTMLPEINVALFGFRVRGSLTGEILPDGEMQLMSEASMNLLGDAITASVAITTANEGGLVGADIGVGPADADPLNPNTMGFCSPKKTPPAGYECVKTPTLDGKSFRWRLTPPGDHPAELDPHLMPFCNPAKAPPVGYRCASITNRSGTGSQDRLIALRPGIVRLGGVLPLEGLDFSWDGATQTWGGEATVLLGDILPGPSVLKSALADADLTVGAQIDINPLSLREASFALNGASIPIGPAQLDSASFDLKLKPKLDVSGNASLEAGPGKTIAIDGGFEIKQGHQSGVDVKIDGSVEIKTITVAGYVEYDGTDGGENVLLGGSFTRSWGPVSATLGIGGGISANPFHFQLTGDGSIDAFGATVGAHGIVSDAGVGACGELHVLLFSGEVGFKHFWSGETDFNGCDFQGLYTVGAPGAADVASAARSTLLPHGLAREEFAAVGASGPPDVTLTGPHGERLSTPAQPDHITITKQGLELAVTSSRTTYFIVTHPAAGRWTLRSNAGSTTPLRYERADPLRPLRIRARVAGGGSHRTLSWRFAAQRGLAVRFLQTGGTARTITESNAGAGHKAFRISPGPGGVRKISAVVLIDGFPVSQATVARFKAAAPSLPRVKRPRYRVSGNAITVSWSPVRGALRYEVDMKTTTGVLRYLVPGSARQVKLSSAGTGRLLRITITTTAGVGRGPSVTARRVP